MAPILTPESPADAMRVNRPVSMQTDAGTLTDVLMYESDEERRAREAEAKKLREVAARTRLLKWLNDRWTEAYTAKRSSGVTEELEECGRRIDGKYTAAREAELKAAGFPAFWFPITRQKVNACRAWKGEYKNAQMQGMFQIKPSAIPSVPEDVILAATDEIYRQAIAAVYGGVVVEDAEIDEVLKGATAAAKEAVGHEAKERAKGMQVAVQDDFDDAMYAATVDAASDDAIDFGTGIVKAPIVAKRKREVWEDGRKVVRTMLVREAAAINPQDMFPAPHKTRANDGAWVIERIRTDRNSVADILDSPYAIKAEVGAFMRETQDGNVTRMAEDENRETAERKDTGIADDRIEMYEFHGYVGGEMIKPFGIEGVQATRDYHFCITFSPTRVLEVRPNWDDMERECYHWLPFKRRNGSIWGIGIPMLVKAAQDAGNGGWCALLKNAQWSSAPIGYGDDDRVVNPDSLRQWCAGVMIPTHNNMNLTSPPIGILNVPNNVASFLSIIQQAIGDADVSSEVPAYQHGTDRAAGAGSTYGGLQLLFEASARGLNDFFFNIDNFGVEPIVRLLVSWHNDYNEDDSIKGDVTVQALGHRGLMMKAMQLSAIREALDSGQNSLDAALLGPMWRLSLHKRWAEMNGLVGMEESFPKEIDMPAWAEVMKQSMIANALGQGQGQRGQEQVSAAGGAGPGMNQGGPNTAGTPPRQTVETMAGTQ